MSDLSKTQMQMQELSILVRTQLGFRDKSLARQLTRAGRHMPRRLRRDLEPFIQAEGFHGHPKLMRTLDETAMDDGFGRLQSYLKDIDIFDRRANRVLDVLGSLVLNLVIFATFLWLFLRWKGFV